MPDILQTTAAGWDADSPPALEFLFDARVKLHLPALDLGPMPAGSRVIFPNKPRLRGGATLS